LFSKHEIEEIKKCKNSFTYFCENYLYIIDKNNKTIKLRLNNAQKHIFDKLEENSFIKILKARQLGSSTFIAAFYFWKTLLNVNERTVVIAHQHDSVKQIFRIYKTFYDNLPKFLKFKCNTNSANTLEFDTGSYIKVGSASSEAFRGSSAISNLHLSEVAFWENMKDTVASIFAAVSNNPTIILETTPNGMNDFFHFWSDENGYYPIFLSWMTDEKNILPSLPYDVSRLLNGKTEVERLVSSLALSEQQKNWAINVFFKRCAGDLSKFKQEYASDEVTCFLTSGDRFFTETFILDQNVQSGYIEYKPPMIGRIYSIGVDAAGGSNNGDYSAFVVTDITVKEYPQIVATFYERMPLLQYAERVYQECLKYKAFAVVEKNSYGLAIIEHLVQREYSFIYTRTVFDKIENRYTEDFGFNTTMSTRPILLARLQSFINHRKIVIEDPRLQKEINSFIYINGKAQADRNQHDDMIMALGLSLIAFDQYEYVQQNALPTMPQNASEWMKLELSMGIPKEELIRQGFVKDLTDRVNQSPLRW